MTTKTVPFVLTPKIQRYGWGDPHFIPQLLGLPGDGGPYAEAWYGAHPSAAATAELGPDSQALDDLIDARGADLLGKQVKDEFGGLPYLLKILAAAKPLSIQVHPNLTQAREGFAREQAAGLAADAPGRNYRDANHKPEALLALTEFYALCGFRPPAQIAAVLSEHPELASLLPSYTATPESLKGLLKAYFSLPDRTLQPALRSLIGRLPTGAAASDPAYWAILAHDQLSAEGSVDRGVLFVLLLNLVTLSPAQTIFLPAGVPHAYLRGAGLELMASSDNVLRAGLTPKHVDAQELMQVVRFDARAPVVLEAQASRGGEYSYALPSAEFAIYSRSLAAGETFTSVATGPDTLLAIPATKAGRVRVSWEGGSVSLGAGGACMVPAGCRYTIAADCAGQLFRAAVPDVADAGDFRGRSPTQLSFGTSGLRGLVTDITDLEAYINTRGFVDYLVATGDAVPGTQLAIGGDLRPSTHSPERSITRAVARAVTDAGLEVTYCGQLPTPALTLFGLSRQIPSIMVTGSHIPFDRNGIKFNTSKGEVLKPDEAPILAAVGRVRFREYTLDPSASMFDDGGWLRPAFAPQLPPEGGAARAEYVQRYLNVFPADALAGLRIVMFEHSAVGRELVADILRRLGAEVFAAGRSETFVAIDTEAIAEDRLRQLQTLADESRARYGTIDAIVSTDGDSDRPMLLAVDAAGLVHFFSGDVLGALVADYLEADCVAVPISANDLIDAHFVPRGVKTVRTRIGSPWVIAAMKELDGQRIVGWEANGGFLTGSTIPLNGGSLAPLATRDAVLPLLAALHSARKTNKPLASLPESLPSRFGKSGLLDHVPVSESRTLLAAFGPGNDLLRKIQFVDASVRATGFAGEERSLTAGETSRLLRLRATLAHHFSVEKGFGALEEMDVLDGLRLQFQGGDVAHVRPSGNAPQLRIYALANSVARAEEIATLGLAEPSGLLRSLLSAAPRELFVSKILKNIAGTHELFAHGKPAAIIGSVAGSAGAARFWERRWEIAKPAFGARAVSSQHEDLPVNQAFGLLLLWQRLKPQLLEGEGALLAFVFGEGSRAAPWTEAECGQKPALDSFVSVPGAAPRRRLSVVELALRYFAPVEAYLRRSGFDGIVVKWGDEIQIPTRELSGSDPLFADADIVRFVSLMEMTEDDSANKDWVGVAPNGHVTAFIPRRPLAEMRPLAARGLIQERNGKLFGGVNLGSVALSRPLLDALLAEFASDVNDANADRKQRPDLDPQLFTALTIAALSDPRERSVAWTLAVQESPAMASLASLWPGVLERLRRALDQLERSQGRPLKMVAMDFGDQYWGDVGQHSRMFELFMTLREHTAEGEIARALAGLEAEFDEHGNLIAGDTRLGDDVSVKNSVLIDVQVASGSIEDSVLLGTRCHTLSAKIAFDVESALPQLTLGLRAGSYKVISSIPVSAGPGERVTTVFLPDEQLTVRVHEDTDLRAREGNYERPILGNGVSFASLHQRVLSADPTLLEQRRQRAREEVLRTLAFHKN